QLARSHSDVKVCFGLHPWAAARLGPGELESTMVALAGYSPVAMGEMGLDRSRYVPRGSLPAQVVAFRAQLAVARERDLPVVLHVVGAHGAALEILQNDGVPAAGGMVHSYSGSAELVPRYEALGLHISFSASVTRPDARRVTSAVRAVSPQRLLVETDCPDQRPFARVGAINHPQWLIDVINAVAEIRGVPRHDIATQSAHNAEALFGSF
ncbi:MAG: TatD DNase family protein, partial [Myxococcota bacterium]